MRVTAVVVFVLLYCTSDGSAQVFTPARAPSTPEAKEKRIAAELAVILAESEVEGAKADSRRGILARADVAALEAKVAALRERRDREVEADAGRRRGSFLTQAALEGIANDGSPEVSIQAAELFFNHTYRVYLRSTLSTDSDSDDAGDGESDPAAALEARVKSALLDPYGGLLYLAAGAFRPVLTPVFGEGQTPRGLFFDARGGVRAVQLDETQSESNSIVPFATISAGLQFQWPVWDEPTLSSDDDSVGDFVFGLTWVGNAALDRSVSDMFSGDEPLLDRWTHTLALTAGISLKGMAKLTFTGNPWSSNSALGKRFSVGLALVREE